MRTPIISSGEKLELAFFGILAFLGFMMLEGSDLQILQGQSPSAFKDAVAACMMLFGTGMFALTGWRIINRPY